MSDWTLHLGDCIEGMRTLADDSVDVSISDAPYDDHTHTKGRKGNSIAAKRGAQEGRRAAGAAAISRNRDLGFGAITQTQMADFAYQLARVVRRWSLIFCSIEMVGDEDGRGWRGHLERAGLQYVRTAFWHKLGSTPQFTGDRPANAAEAIVIAHRPGRKRWNGGGKHGYYAHAIVLERSGVGVRCHTTQKPLPLMLDLVADFSDPDELVLDAFAGSGTTGVACRQLGRRFIGWELSPEYHAIATRRLNGDEAKPRPEQPSLFGAGGL